MTLKEIIVKFIVISRMNEIDKTNLIDQTKFRLGEITKIKNYFNEETNQRKSCSKKLSKYVADFDDIDNVLFFLSGTSGGVFIISFTSVVAAPAGIASASFTLICSLTRGIIKKLLSLTKNKKSMTKFFCWLKVS